MLLVNAAVTLAGKPEAVPIPVAPVVVCVIAVKGVLIHKVGALDAAPEVFTAVTVIVFVDVETHPLAAVPVIVYVVVALAVKAVVFVILLLQV